MFDHDALVNKHVFKRLLKVSSEHVAVFSYVGRQFQALGQQLKTP